ncbi:SPFH domain-containing protein [Cellulophaga baltica]|uniref:Membrane protein n=1 Tax=Cellulophaga baltica 18 TaxID=1348584 RepID=A0AAU8RVG8_9FLAO|nr:SPFH domain-containing protein [Cellulophaga baltica]AIY12000.1 membrane protein [Cellulophaga baltica NN016038]AIZ40369.1 membrane protein [Cellulophaga baltica 18]MBA6314197.1 SPFH domain-containing protein [Cellulophaga baltica]WFO15626.1 SPFH domain-containing protein [Cellulophaga baltica 4]
MDFKKQMRSVIQWEDPKDYQLFFKFTDRGDELKNASKLILQPGQGCIFTYEGKIEGFFETEGIYDLKTSNTPFWTTIKKFMNAFESEHKTGLWFYRKAELLNVRWGTRIPITYNDPVYSFPVKLRAYGNYSLRITNAKEFFINILAGQTDYFVDQLQEVFLSRITQPISSYLANAKFSYAEIDGHIETIAQQAQLKTTEIFEKLGFQLTDFRIEGTSFDPETNKRISEISDVQADVNAASIAGIDFAELQRLRAMRDVAKNEGMAGASMGMLTGMEMGKAMSGTTAAPQEAPKNNIKIKLKELKELFEEDLISEEEFQAKKQQLLDQL